MEQVYLLELDLWRKDGQWDVWALLRYFGSVVVPHRPGRFEPRVLKRRRHRYPMMKIQRQKLKLVEMRKLA